MIANCRISIKNNHVENLLGKFLLFLPSTIDYDHHTGLLIKMESRAELYKNEVTEFCFFGTGNNCSTATGEGEDREKKSLESIVIVFL